MSARDRRHRHRHRRRDVDRGVRVLARGPDRPAAHPGGDGPRRPGRALVRRSSVALELAASGLLDPATSLLLAGAAHDARAAGEPNDLAESDLTRALRAAFGQPGFRAVLSEQGRAPTSCSPSWRRPRTRCSWPAGSTTTRWRSTRDARRRPLARVLRLSGRARRCRSSSRSTIRSWPGTRRRADMLHFTSAGTRPGSVA